VWDMIPSLQSCVDCLAPVFTQPSHATSCRLLLAWVMCLGKHTLLRVGENTRPQRTPDHSARHGLDAYYNFFERSSWDPKDLAYRLAVLVLTRLPFSGSITLLVDDTLAHKRGKSVWGLGWWRDAVASTRKRVATAPGHNWVVVAVAFCVPGTSCVILALPLLARLHLPGKGQPSCATLASEMLAQIRCWFPGRDFTLVGDGAYACKEMLGDLPERVRFVGRMRGDAAIYDEGQTRAQADEGPAPAQPQGCGQEGGPLADDRGGLGVAGGVRDDLRQPADAPGGELRGGVAAGAGATADPSGGGARRGGEDGRRVPVHDGPGREPRVGNHPVFLEVVGGGTIPGE
jgi:hypothetical protein